MRFCLARPVLSVIAGSSLALAACSRQASVPPPGPDRAAHGEIAGLVLEERATPVAPGGPQSRALIRRARIDLVVREVGAAVTSIDSTARAFGGEPAAIQRSDRQLSMLLRVPGDRLDAAVASLSTLGRVESQSFSSVEVTDQMADMDARLTNLRAVRDRLRQYLERAESIADVIAVERELVRVQSEIDSLEARLALVRGQVAMAELTVRAREEVRLGPLGALLAGVGNLLQRLFVNP